jgi:hypothetical protein
VKKVERLGEHSGIAITLVNFTPAAAIASMFGVGAGWSARGLKVDS